ncbi:MAG: M28 family peptidase [Candidatus Latescibacterota bacterium]
MSRLFFIAVSCFIFFPVMPAGAQTPDIGRIFNAIQSEVSGNRGRDYVMRLWLHEKWSTLPGWQRAIREAQTIMKERGFDEAIIEEVPADGKTKSGAWTNPVGWDVKQATLEVIEPDVPDEFRYLCNYLDSPTSLNCWSGPTPPEGIETELALWEGSDAAELAKLNARGKIVLTGVGTRGYKRYLDPNGILGFVGDQIEELNVDFTTENQWLNCWSDLPGGWWLTSYDSHKNFGFSISQKKANYLRNLLRRGTKVRVRAKIDSRIYTNDTLPYVVGLVKGTGPEEVFITAHMNEWGANDDAAGCSSILEAVGTLNDLIRSGKLPRPRRSIRVHLGAEMYGSLPYVQKHPDRFKRTVAAVCCDTATPDWDEATTQIGLYMNPNVCPSYTDAVYPEIVRQYLARNAPHRTLNIEPFSMGTDTYFCEPMIGAPTNWIYLSAGAHLHHNSMDTIEKVDPRTLRHLSFINAAYLYYFANAGHEDVPWIANLTFGRGVDVIREKARGMNEKVMNARDGAELGKALAEGTEVIQYYTGLQQEAVAGIERLADDPQKAKARAALAPFQQSLAEVGATASKQLRALAEGRVKNESLKLSMPVRQETAWDREAATLVPKRFHFATLFLEEVPVSEWREVRSSPHWWGATNWASASFWWVDGKRNLKEIKRLCELEAGRPIEGFDLINYYKFLEKFKYAEFVR